jgi:NIPSNAP
MEPAPLVLDTSQAIELRQYTLHPGRRDVLVDLFDRLLLDPQEELGMRVLGQFRDLDAPDRFVWLRGFPDLASRADLLAAFYGGTVWKANRDAANATMLDSDDVLLLRPVDAESGLLLPTRRCPPTATPGGAFVLATAYLLRAPVDDDFIRVFDRRVWPLMAQAGAQPLARYRTEYGRNDYPKLPIREGEHAFVWITSFASEAEHERHRADLARSQTWKESVEPELASYFESPPQELRLAPTARSLLGRHASGRIA